MTNKTFISVPVTDDWFTKDGRDKLALDHRCNHGDDGLYQMKCVNKKYRGFAFDSTTFYFECPECGNKLEEVWYPDPHIKDNVLLGLTYTTGRSNIGVLNSFEMSGE